MVAALLIWLARDYHNLLELEFVEVAGPERHDETLDSTVDAANHNVVLDLGVLEGCKCLTDDGARILRAVHVVVVHHFLVLPFLLVDLVAVSEAQCVHTNVLLLVDRLAIVVLSLLFLVLVSVITLLESLG
jgi:hypothetical protein